MHGVLESARELIHGHVNSILEAHATVHTIDVGAGFVFNEAIVGDGDGGIVVAEVAMRIGAKHDHFSNKWETAR